MAPLGRYGWAVCVVLGTLALQTPLGFAASLSKVWEVDLRKMVHAGSGMTEFPVFALRFSPDGQKLAVIADVYSVNRDRKSRLLVIDAAYPAAAPREFEVEYGIKDGELPLNFGWAPSGKIVYALGTVVHLETGQTCTLPNQSVFIGDNVAILALPTPPNYSSTPLRFYSQNCQETGHWDVPEAWLISGVSAERSLLSVQRDITSAVGGEGLIVDVRARKVLWRWPLDQSPGGTWQFADDGRAICQGGPVLARDRAPATCRNVDTWKVIAQSPTNGTERIATAERATRMVVSDYRRRKIPFSYEYDATFHGRVLWDFGTGKDLVSWYPESQTFFNIFKPGKQVAEPDPFALSSDGQFVAEGGNGVIRVYKIEP
jgi:hypothetical protein